MSKRKYTGIQRRSPAFEAYKKERDRIERYVKAKEKEGFRFDATAIPRIPIRITEASVRYLKRRTAEKLLRKSTFLPEGESSPISGARYAKKRTKERRKQVTQRRKEINAIREQFYIDNTKQLGTGQEPNEVVETLTNAINIIKEMTPTESSLLDDIQEAIQGWTPHEAWAEYFTDVKRGDRNTLTSILRGAIRDEGIEAVAKRLKDSSTDIIALVEGILYSSGGKDGRDGIQRDLITFANIIHGGALTQEQSEEITNTMEDENFETTYIHPHYGKAKKE